jgi:hypothetical protein
MARAVHLAQLPREHGGGRPRPFATDLPRSPSAPASPRLDALRAAGFDDDALLHATEIASYFNFVNRLSDGLGVGLE